jgi:hypothetical protein
MVGSNPGTPVFQSVVRHYTELHQVRTMEIDIIFILGVSNETLFSAVVFILYYLYVDHTLSVIFLPTKNKSLVELS